MSTTTDTRPLSNVPPAGPPPRRRGRAAALIIGGVLTFAFVGWAILTLVTLTSWPMLTEASEVLPHFSNRYTLPGDSPGRGNPVF